MRQVNATYLMLAAGLGAAAIGWVLPRLVPTVAGPLFWYCALLMAGRAGWSARRPALVLASVGFRLTRLVIRLAGWCARAAVGH